MVHGKDRCLDVDFAYVLLVDDDASVNELDGFKRVVVPVNRSKCEPGLCAWRRSHYRRDELVKTKLHHVMICKSLFETAWNGARTIGVLLQKLTESRARITAELRSSNATGRTLGTEGCSTSNKADPVHSRDHLRLHQTAQASFRSFVAQLSCVLKQQR